MENGTATPVVSDCRLANEHDPLWIAAMVMVSAISTLTALILRKRNARAARAPGGVARAPHPSPPLPRPMGEEEREEEEMV